MAFNAGHGYGAWHAFCQELIYFPCLPGRLAAFLDYRRVNNDVSCIDSGALADASAPRRMPAASASVAGAIQYEACFCERAWWYLPGDGMATTG